MACGLYLTIRTGFVQIRGFAGGVRRVVRGMSHDQEGEGEITPFQALSTALASTVGNGNIGGVATAILVGGPGAIFWMWVTAVFGMATKYAEAVLGVTYRVKKESGAFASGPMYYIHGGRQSRPESRRCSRSCLASSEPPPRLLGTGNMAQSNTHRPDLRRGRRRVRMGGLAVGSGLLITAAVGAVLLGGIHRIAAVAEKLVPTMLVIYLGMSLTYLLMNITRFRESSRRSSSMPSSRTRRPADSSA